MQTFLLEVRLRDVLRLIQEISAYWLNCNPVPLCFHRFSPMHDKRVRMFLALKQNVGQLQKCFALSMICVGKLFLCTTLPFLYYYIFNFQYFEVPFLTKYCFANSLFESVVRFFNLHSPMLGCNEEYIIPVIPYLINGHLHQYFFLIQQYNKGNACYQCTEHSANSSNVDCL